MFKYISQYYLFCDFTDPTSSILHFTDCTFHIEQVGWIVVSIVFLFVQQGNWLFSTVEFLKCRQ